MASITNDPNGRKRIQFVAPDESRMTIRLGKCDRKTAESICRHVEALLAAKLSGQPIPRETATWLAGIGDVLYDRLVKAGLVEAKQRLTLSEFLHDWLQRKQASGCKPASVLAWRQTADEAMALFGDKPLTALTHEDGERLRQAMLNRGLRATTVHKRLQHARGMLEDAVRLGLLEQNPWKYVRYSSGDVSERRAYVPIADVQRVLDCCPNAYWRLLVALARFAGLRIPSEAFSLRWRDVDWANGRIVIPSPKTEGRGKPYRVIPLFPLLKPHMEDAYELAPTGAEYVFPDELRQRALRAEGTFWANANLRTKLAKIIRRAGLQPWPRLWHSLRASCESDLAQAFPLATVTKWLGNTPSVALRHYVDPTEQAFTKAQNWVPEHSHSGAKSGAQAAQNAAQQGAAGNSTEEQPVTEPLADCNVMPLVASRNSLLRKDLVEVRGFEPLTS